jgi:hypothetical protein
MSVVSSVNTCQQRSDKKFAVRPQKDVPQGLTSKITMDLAGGFFLPTLVATPLLLASPWLLDILAGYVGLVRNGLHWLQACVPFSANIKLRHSVALILRVF